ncbi:MAG TPA: hypothetical protein PKH79_13300 [Prolixibacteraceae bacterium]|nr:hypothetical protein [Prolixibacteraceae bacterium]HPS12887.1 hypothetical protein [Prolixibacteraceae bacterium]
MSKQKSKKASPQMLKQQEAESRKQFYLKVKNYIEQCGYPELFKQLSEKELAILFKYRIHPPIIKIKGHIPSAFRNEKELTQFIYKHMQLFMFNIPNSDRQISLYDYATIGLLFYLNSLRVSKNPDQSCENRIINEKIGSLNGSYEMDKMVDVLAELFSRIELVCSNFATGIYQVKIVDTTSYFGVFKPSLFFLIEEIYHPKPIEIKIGDTYRPIFEVGYTHELQFRHIHIPIAKLKLGPTYPSNINVPVFIQSHALYRLYERMDKLPAYFIQTFACDSLIKADVRKTAPYSFLISYRYENFKIGYFAADFIKNKLVIRTFLLLTQEGSPEAQKFKRLTGLTRDDIEYLKITKLSTFIGSDISKNERLKSIFDEAGLSGIYQFADSIYCWTETNFHVATLLNQYLNTESDTPDWHEVANSYTEKELGEEQEYPMPTTTPNMAPPIQVPEKRAFTPKASTIKQISS